MDFVITNPLWHEEDEAEEAEEQIQKVEAPEWASCLDEDFRYKVFYGGRGSAKSWTVARWLLKVAREEKKKILCGRELQTSIQDSVMALLTDQIYQLGWQNEFEITRSYITHHLTGSVFLFKGLKHNISEIRSMEGIDICWIEEAHRVSKESWKNLIPTIRRASSELVITFNPDLEDDETYQRFVVNPPPRSIVIKVNHDKNPWFPEVLREEMEYLRRVDMDAYLNVWEGHPRKSSDAQIFKDKWRVDRFDIPSGTTIYHGADWGFSQDPTVFVKCFIHENKLYIRNVAYRVGCEIDDLPDLYDEIPDAKKYHCRGDSARPELISHLSGKGYPIVSVKKWPDSVVHGISVMRAFEEIVIHEECENAIEEFKNYSYKVDKNSGEPTTEIIDLHNHVIDAIRYAIQTVIQERMNVQNELLLGMHR